MSETYTSHLDPWSLAVIILTLVLFVLALVIKGFTHGLLLETGVFLVSVKLIIMAYRNHVSARAADARLQQIESLLRDIQAQLTGPRG